MAHETWEHVNRVRDMGVQIGDYLTVERGFRGLGDLAGRKSRQMLAQLSSDVDTSIKIMQRADRELNDIATAAAQTADALSQAQQALSMAQDLAAEVDDPAALRLVERVEKSVADLEALAVTIDEAYTSLSAGAPVGDVSILQAWKNQTGTPEDAANMPAITQAWIQFGQALDKARSSVASIRGKRSSIVSAARAAAKQVQTIYDRAMQRQQTELARQQQREAQEVARENARIAREQALENARYQQQMQMEQQSYALQQAALAPPPTYTPPPAGYQYQDPYAYQQVAPPVQYQQQYAAPQQYSAVRYADEPASWGYAQPQQVFQPASYQVPQAQYGMTLPPGWTSAEFQALQQGEGNYLWGLKGLRGLGKAAAPTPTGVKSGTYQFAAGTTAGGAPGSGGALGIRSTTNDPVRGSAWSTEKQMEATDSWLPSSQSISDAVSTALTMASSILPAFLQPPQPAPVAPEPSILPTVLGAGAVVAGVGGLAYVVSKSLSKGGSRRRSSPRRRRR